MTNYNVYKQQGTDLKYVAMITASSAQSALNKVAKRNHFAGKELTAKYAVVKAGTAGYLSPSI